jgi:putative Mg2+ transporter-C (MgtC) family protein
MPNDSRGRRNPKAVGNFAPVTAFSQVMTDSFLASAFFGTAMPLQLTWPNMALRLLCTLIAGAVIGLNPGERGKAAGLRTTMLVCLAAAIAMLQMNYLLALAGRSGNSFVMNDLMRLPLGILTGVGFIGGGAILRRGNLVIGVTTAATPRYVTVIGLCFGGGQVLLGWAATALGLFVLWGLKWLEEIMSVQQQARLAVTVDETGPSESEICRRLASGTIEVRDIGLATDGRCCAPTQSLCASFVPSPTPPSHHPSKS